MSEQLMTPAAAIDASDELLQRAQRQGMESARPSSRRRRLAMRS